MEGHPRDDDLLIRQILETARTIALVGASPNPTRPSHQVMGFLLRHGYRVYPVNPMAGQGDILGRAVYSRLADLPEPVDMVDVFRRPKWVMPIVREAIAIDAKALWLQLGVVDEDAAEVARAAGIQVVMDRCPAIEFPRLGLNRSR